MAKKTKSQARKTSSDPTFVFTMGVPNVRIRISDEHKKIIHDQVFKAWLYRKQLVEIECERRNEYRKIRARLSPEIEQAEQQHDQLVAEYEQACEKLHVPKKLRKEEDIKQARELGKKVKESNDVLRLQRASVEELFLNKAREEFAKRKQTVTLQHLAENRPELKEEAERLLAGRPEGMNEKEYEAAKTVLANKRGPRDNRLKEKINAIRQDMLNNGWSEWFEISEIDSVASQKNKEARKQSGCFVGTAAAVEAAARVSFRKSYGNPKIPPFTSEGKVGVQLQENNGLKVSDALAERSPVLKLSIPEKQPYLFKNKRGNKVAGTARIRLIARPQPVFIDVPFVMHRPLPEDGVIKWAYLVCKRIGTRRIYELQLTVESSTFLKRTLGDKQLAINFGWRVLKNGDIRVATTWDGERSENIILPKWMRERDKFASSVLGFADNHFNEARQELSEFLKQKDIDYDLAKSYKLLALYEELQLKNLSHWRAHGKLAKVTFAFRDAYLSKTDVKKLWNEWKKSRLSIGEDLFDSAEVLFHWFSNQGVTDNYEQMALYLEWWRRKDKHLIDCARSIQRKLRLHRREIYRRKVANWAKEYGNVRIELWDKNETARIPKIEYDNETQQEELARAVRQFCGVSICTGALKQVFGKNLKKIDPQDITLNHFGCGGMTISDPKEAIGIVCGKCGHIYDQDVNAAKHLWHGGVPGGSKKPSKRRNSSELRDNPAE